jgi:hypothetical protein
MTVRMTSPSVRNRAASGVDSAWARDERVIVVKSAYRHLRCQALLSIVRRAMLFEVTAFSRTGLLLLPR